MNLELEDCAKQSQQSLNIKNVIVKKAQTRNNFAKIFTDYLEENVRTELYEIIFKIIRTPHFIIKAYLFICVLVASGLASYTVIESFIDYFSYGVVTTSRTMFEIPTLFPKVTICNVNPFTTEYAYNFLKELDTSNSFFDKILTFEESTALLSTLYYKAMNKVNDKSISDQTRKNLSHTLKDMMISCMFNGVACNSSDFVWKFDPIYGNCFVFNSGIDVNGQSTSLRETNVAGQYYGLQLEMYVNFFEKLTEFNSAYGAKGLIIKVDNSSYLTEHKGDGIQISAGFDTYIDVRRSFKFMLAKPYSDCDLDNESPNNIDSDLYRLISHSEYEYTQQLCFEQCYQKESIKSCGCEDAVLSLYNTSVCISDNEIKCMNDVYYNKYTTKDYIERICLPLCPLECNKTEYNAVITFQNLLGSLYYKYIQESPSLSADFLTRTLNSDTAPESISSFTIFYDSLSYNLSKETPKIDIIGLLAAIGGNLGLFLGISLLSVCEFFETLIEIYFIKKENKVLAHHA